MQCRKYEARIEDYLHGGADSELRDHLSRCEKCRTALEDARMGKQWLSEAWEPTGEPGSPFLTGVMARIREEQMRAQSPAAFWNPIVFLASRLSLTAAMLLFALSMYMAESARHATALPPSTRTELSAADFPQPPKDPVSNEEVLQSLVERSYGR
jgi:hypothetical protein